jgi:hypothetical protein
MEDTVQEVEQAIQPTEEVKPKHPLEGLESALKTPVKVGIKDLHKLGLFISIEVGGELALVPMKGARDIALHLRKCANIIEKELRRLK